jgi:hypothetical protein
MSHLSMNAYEVPWLHLDIIGCVMKFFGPSLHYYLCHFLLLATIFEQVQQIFCSPLSHFLVKCHMVLRF